MGRNAKPEFEVKKSTVPNGEQNWFIIGRPNGKRVRAWFPTKEKAQAEATERNVKMRKLGSDSAQVDNSLIVMAIEGAAKLAPFRAFRGRRRHRLALRRIYLAKSDAVLWPLD
jgi:hypothetical protein